MGQQLKRKAKANLQQVQMQETITPKLHRRTKKPAKINPDHQKAEETKNKHSCSQFKMHKKCGQMSAFFMRIPIDIESIHEIKTKGAIILCPLF